MSPDTKPIAQVFKDKVFEALQSPGTTIWYGDWWIRCIKKEYNELQYWPQHRPIWMTKGEWDQLRNTIKDFRLALVLNEKPLFMTEEEWTRIMDVKSRHGLLPDTNPNLTMDEIEAKLDEDAKTWLEKYEEDYKRILMEPIKDFFKGPVYTPGRPA